MSQSEEKFSVDQDNQTDKLAIHSQLIIQEYDR